MTRVTTNGTLYTYRYNFLKTSNSMNNAMMKVMTQRNFNSYSADPAAATRAFKIHSSLNETRTQYGNNQAVLGKYETAWKNMQGVIDDLSDKLGQVPALEGLNGTNLDNLDTQAKVLRAGAEAIVQSMNSKYNGDFIFAGSDNNEPPFAISDDGHITYRGVKVDQDLDQEYKDKDGNPVLNPDTGENYTNQEMLDKWAKEDPLYVDIGLGFELDNNGNVIPSTAFDASISGIGVLGYGKDEDGDPKNLASIMLRLAEIFEGYDKDAEGDKWNGNSEEANRLINKFKDSKEAMIDAHADLDAKAKFLNNNGVQLETRFDALNTERAGIEDVDPVDAIMELTWAQTCFQAALQVGTNVIPQSLMDYLK